jgi:iron-sulfur cluster repair protein YtfE (RIC family)
MNATNQQATELQWTSLRGLIEHIVDKCHDELRMVIPELAESAERVAQAEGLPAWLKDQLQLELTALADLLETHISQQEGWLFPTVRHLGEVAETTELSGDLGEGVEYLMKRVSLEHRQMQTIVERITTSLNSSAASSLGSLVDELREDLRVISEQLPTHSHLETHVLFPWISRTLKEEGFTNDTTFW